ncbi:hypothetical protein SGLAM104S_03546 [Streptomyces glaucescens]
MRSDGDLVFYNQPAHSSGAVRHEGKREAGGRVTDTLHVDLARVEPAVETVVLAASADGGTFGRVPELSIEVRDAAQGALVARFDSADATVETAFVLGEFYRRQGAWKFRAVGQGYSSGLEGLATDFGITVDEPRHAAPPATAPAVPPAPPVTASVTMPPPLPTPAQAPPVTPPPAAPVRLTKVTLTKAAPAVSLTKQGGTSGALKVNLNWQVRKQFSGWGAKFGRAVALHSDLDLDLCALYELADGSKGVVQALGNAFGALHRPPYIHLDGDDRTGAVTTGENLTVNLDFKDAFRRILVFVTIYEGARSFADLNATVTLQPQYGAAVDFSLDECTVPVPGVRAGADHQHRRRPDRPARGPLPDPRARGQPAADRRPGLRLGHELDTRSQVSETGVISPRRAPRPDVRRCGPSRPHRAPGSAAPRNPP